MPPDDGLTLPEIVVNIISDMFSWTGADLIIAMVVTFVVFSLMYLMKME